jgi:uncharacterized protein YuzE
MILRYESGIFYVKVHEGEVEDTLELNPETYLDIDKNGQVLAYEFWNGSEVLENLKTGKEFVLPEVMSHA